VIFNADKGGKYTSQAFPGMLQHAEVRISMAERLWRKGKYEHLYLHTYTDGRELHRGLGQYFHAYNHEDPHSSLNMSTPYALWK